MPRPLLTVSHPSQRGQSAVLRAFIQHLRSAFDGTIDRNHLTTRSALLRLGERLDQLRLTEPDRVGEIDQLDDVDAPLAGLDVADFNDAILPSAFGWMTAVARLALAGPA